MPAALKDENDPLTLFHTPENFTLQLHLGAGLSFLEFPSTP